MESQLDKVLECLHYFYQKNQVLYRNHEEIRDWLAKTYGESPSDLVMILGYFRRKTLVLYNEPVTSSGWSYLLSYEGKELYDSGGFANISKGNYIPD